MKRFKHFILENTSFRRKGWINIETGKMVLTAFAGRGIRPYHDEMAIKNAKKFVRGGEESLLRQFAAEKGVEPEDDEAISAWVDIKTGKVDRDKVLDSILEGEGWRRVVFDEGTSSVEARNPREAQELVGMIIDDIPWSKIEFLVVYEKGSIYGDTVDIYSEEDAEHYARRGFIPQRTDIGRTMSMFRNLGEFITEALNGKMLIGWLDQRNRMHLYPEDRGSNKYHAQILTRLLSYEEIKRHMGPEIRDQTISDMGHFVDSGDMTREQINDIIDNSYENMINKLKTGKIDGHYQMEESLMKNGWVKIRIDRRGVGGFSSILSSGNTKRGHDAAKVLDRELGGWSNIAAGAMIIDGEVNKIRDGKTWDVYIKTGRIPKRTEIGNTISRFR